MPIIIFQMGKRRKVRRKMATIRNTPKTREKNLDTEVESQTVPKLYHFTLCIFGFQKCYRNLFFLKTYLVH